MSHYMCVNYRAHTSVCGYHISSGPRHYISDVKSACRMKTLFTAVAFRSKFRHKVPLRTRASQALVSDAATIELDMGAAVARGGFADDDAFVELPLVGLKVCVVLFIPF